MGIAVQGQTARRLLSQTTLTLPEVALRCGYASASTFSRAFTALEGNTPARFRRAQQRARPAIGS